MYSTLFKKSYITLMPLIVISLFSALGCSEPQKDKRKTDSVTTNGRKSDTTNQLQIKRQKIEFIDLGTVKSSIIKNYNALEHKTFSTKGEKDSLSITPDFNSVLTANYLIKGKNDEEGDIILSRFKLLNNNKVFFDQDSVLAITAFELDKKKQRLSFSIISDQNADTFNTTSDLFLIDLRTNAKMCLRKRLINTVNSPFSEDGKSVYYLDNSFLFKYDLQTKSEMKIMEFGNAVILHIEILNPTQLNIIYLKDISDGVKYMTNVKLPTASGF
ncbi:hypothetical protein MTO98_10190 [Mucilaginibacter sp. SMC90]|uniref:hypothetical protein n=1 Tax=Mucilaginibacter sp. SMC90 TaxID=2929803 RepID=UPI001FB515CE|nr:hypothetical protein [Mucilaginibacter sp. SMC90]UOE51446.1 hypothetical protein MTO98_10190 [Mucilaginibacter sp. SMC90]